MLWNRAQVPIRVSLLLLAALAAGCSSREQPLSPVPLTADLLVGANQGGIPHEPRETRSVPRQVVARVDDDSTIEEVNAAFATTTIHQLPGTRFYLLQAPPYMPEGALAVALAASDLCDVGERNYLMETPEAERGFVAFFEGDFTHGDYVDQEAMQRIGGPAAHLLSTGAGVRVAVVDTGVDLDHPDLIDNLGPGWDFVDDDPSPGDLPDFQDNDGDGFFDEATGHGSHVAGIVALAAPDVTILPYRVLDSDGLGNVFDVAEAIRRAIADGADVINLSLGMDERSEVMRRAIKDARGVGILVVSSAGNRGIEDSKHFPARESDVMAVTATTANDGKAPFASYGPHVDISAPGAGIMSTYWNGGYAIWSGTSMSTPFIAGAAAIAVAIDPALPDLQATIEETSLDLDLRSHAWGGKIGKGRVRLDVLACRVAPECDESATAGPDRFSRRMGRAVGVGRAR